MAYGLQVFDASGTLVFDSTTAVGGVPVGFWSGGAGTLSFPQFAGLTMQSITIDGAQYGFDAVGGVTISHTSGFPVVTVASDAPTFMLAVF